MNIDRLEVRLLIGSEQTVYQVAQSIRLADARRYMMTFNTALGVQCRDCHDLRDFSSDDNELKLVSREMMRMTKAINETWFPEAETEVEVAEATAETVNGHGLSTNIIEASLEAYLAGLEKLIGHEPASSDAKKETLV